MNNDILCFEGQTNRRRDGRTDVLHMPIIWLVAGSPSFVRTSA